MHGPHVDWVGTPIDSAALGCCVWGPPVPLAHMPMHPRPGCHLPRCITRADAKKPEASAAASAAPTSPAPGARPTKKATPSPKVVGHGWGWEDRQRGWPRRRIPHGMGPSRHPCACQPTMQSSGTKRRCTPPTRARHSPRRRASLPARRSGRNASIPTLISRPSPRRRR